MKCWRFSSKSFSSLPSLSPEKDRMRRSTAIKSFHPSFQARLEELEWIKSIGRAKRDESFIGTTSRTKLNDLFSDSVWPLHFLKRALFQVFQLFLVFQDFQDFQVFQVFQVSPFCHFHLLSIHSYKYTRYYRGKGNSRKKTLQNADVTDITYISTYIYVLNNWICKECTMN